MTSLNQFLETIEIAGDPLGDEHKAYRMDSSINDQDMRRMADLGTCHCSDYFLPKNESIVLIEETQILKRVENIRGEYEYLPPKDKDKIVNQLIRERMQLKAYGAMLILCRLAAKCSDVNNLIRNKKYHFWLVASSIATEEEKRFFDSLKDSLRGTLTQVLGKKLLDDVEVMSSEILETKLSEK